MVIKNVHRLFEHMVAAPVIQIYIHHTGIKVAFFTRISKALIKISHSLQTVCAGSYCIVGDVGIPKW